MEKEILEGLKQKEPLVLEAEDKNKTHGVLSSLSKKQLVRFEHEIKTTYVLTENGKDVLSNGSYEYRFLQYVEDPERHRAFKECDWFDSGRKSALKNKAVSYSNNEYRLLTPLNEYDDKVKNELENIEKAKSASRLLKEKLVEPRKTTVYTVWRDVLFNDNPVPELSLLSLKDYSSYAEGATRLKEYNINSNGTRFQHGAPHPLTVLSQRVKEIFVEMGFEEMDSRNYVESSFWNFDSLFIPQLHPSRDSQDTFYVSGEVCNFDDAHLRRVHEVHERGTLNGFNLSRGYRSNFKDVECRRALLRTHSTNASSRFLYSLAKNFRPAKAFSVDRVFRNEAIDATHLSEFHQVEGLVAGYGLGLAHLKGIITEFYSKLGIRNLRFKPTYNPYTEPSMEIYAYNEELKRWVELANSGVFRPEMLLPLGLPKDVRVIAWGLALERPAMMLYQLNDIRKLMGHRVDVEFIRTCRHV